MHRAEISGENISAMAGVLTNEELGAAIRILSVLLVSGKPIPLPRLPAAAGVSPEHWEEISDAVLSCFLVLASGSLSHDLLERRSLPACIGSRNSLGAAEHMQLPVERTRRNQVATFAAPNRPEPISIRKAIFDNGVELFTRADKSPATARSLIASLAKTYRDGDLAEAFAAAIREKDLIDPYPWILEYLKRSATPKSARYHQRPSSAAPRPRAPRPEVTPEFLGVSPGRAEEIRKRNRNLTLDLGLDEPQ